MMTMKHPGGEQGLLCSFNPCVPSCHGLKRHCSLSSSNSSAGCRMHYEEAARHNCNCRECCHPHWPVNHPELMTAHRCRW
mmetsp:Transcript_126562/g.244017  ORF Transcript_126562/g.244017 Transcript_126562/m.244017 type:complete len:80 (+) Transcript_126562:1-240(+)